ncbi:hypothetical protein FE257_008318 [Aspergillus nanangensis]|uniref:Major facilitator superfamily (MFS) profile domain-containing protein n=1 Tax=Aspergillus nanangensis TaxID=2582783 RepID=A0AAD4CM25_ASPNN|nr:hypothetical protein FE257_008318 [Aspergillus nanangensis]
MASQDVEENIPLMGDGDAERQDEDYESYKKSDLIDFDPNGDPDNPLEWSQSSKRGIVALLAFAGFSVSFNCVSVVPVAGHISRDLTGTNGANSITTLLVTIWELGEAAGPLLIAPLSELYGRYPVINICNMMLITTTFLAAISPSMASLIALRALTGMLVTSNVLNPAIVGDIFPPEKRGSAMSVVSFVALIGGSVGPAVSGIVVQTFGWRAVLWISFALACASALAFFTLCRETYKPSILRQRAARQGKKIDDSAIAGLHAHAKQQGGHSSSGLAASIKRPVVVLFGSGVLVALSLFGSVVYAFFYVISVTLPRILEEVYGLSPAAIGTAFLSNGIGSSLGICLCRCFVDRIYIHLRTKNGIGLPEYRMPMMMVGAFMMPLATLLYGWCAAYKMPLALLLTSVVWLRMSLALSYLPLSTYIVDACGLYSASAMTGLVVMRCLAGAFMPLLTTFLIGYIGYGWGLTMLSLFTVAVALIPVLVYYYGATWRQSSRFTRTRGGL